jgi:adenylate kinase
MLAEKVEFDGLVVVEGHLSHRLGAEVVIVLRCNPLVLKERLGKKGWSEEKILENVEAEIVDAILVEALERDDVYEIDTTSMDPEEVADAVERVIKGEVSRNGFKPGRIDWIGEVADRIDELMRKI